MKSLYITALGHAMPDTVLESASFGGADAPFEISERRTSLSTEYIEQTSNSEPFIVEEHLTDTPTSLAVRAAEMAFQRAGGSAESLELLIGSTSTPLETTPTEGQRVGKQLGVKIPSYDIHSGGADFALQFETICSWKEERVPDSILVASTHIPTSRLNFAAGEERFLFGDGAAVALLGKDKGAYRIQHASTEFVPAEAKRFTIDVYGHLAFEREAAEQEIFVPKLTALYDAIKDQISGDALMIESQLSPIAHEALQSNVGADRTWHSDFSQYGNMLGASPLVSLSLLHDSLNTEQVVIFASGIGLSAGVIVLTREG